MGCMQPHTSGGWVSPGYPPPIMLLDTDITGKTKIIKHKKQKATEVLPEIYNTKLNNELNGNV